MREATAPIPPADAPATSRLALLARDIRLSHTVFAMPWALLATFLAAEGWPKAGQLLLILLCMVFARTLAMSANRLLDARLDALNPRTAGRAIPSGRLSRAFYVGVIVACAAGFMACTAMFGVAYANPWPLRLGAPVLAFLAAYPLMKRFTQWCHYYLGAALALAPTCAWIAIRGDLSPAPLLMSGAVLLWTAGFDILYACQDYESDLKTGTSSIPARIGIPAALWVARLTHLAAAAHMFALAWAAPPLATLYLVGACAAALLLIVEHAIVRPTDLSRLNVAFFTINGIVSVLVGTLGIVDIFF